MRLAEREISERHAAPGHAQQMGHVRATDELREDLLVPILRELREEPCAHSWQPLLAATPKSAIFDRFLHILESGRPARVFTYFASIAGRDEPLAIGVVSDRVSSAFPEDGLPVLGRAYVRPAYRGGAIYTTVLRHRLDYCVAKWDSRLMAIHLGSASPQVEHALRKYHKGRVVYLGDEDLGRLGSVRAFLALTERFEKQIQHPPEGLQLEHAELLQFLAEGAGAIRPSDIMKPANALASHGDAFRLFQQFLCSLPTLH
jgi:hypothetical protein